MNRVNHVQLNKDSSLTSHSQAIFRRTVSSMEKRSDKGNYVSNSSASSKLALQFFSDPSPPPGFDESQFPHVQSSGGPLPDNGSAIASIEAGEGPAIVESENVGTPENKEEEIVQAALQPGQLRSQQTNPAHNVAAQLSTGGRSLDLGIQQKMNNFFGRDLSSVRIHDSGRANNLTSSFGAQAFTVGNKIAFNSGRYQPGTVKGQQLLAHELTHVCQQSDGLGKEILASGMGSHGDRYEREAEENSERYLSSGQAAQRHQGQIGKSKNSQTLQMYSGSAAATYAKTWALSTNPSYPRMANDCTNFVSQAMIAGGWTQRIGSSYCSDRKKNSVWWYRRNGCSYWWRSNVHASHTWGGAENFYQFTRSSGRGTVATHIHNLDIGDVLQMAFSGTHVGHTMIATGKRNGNLYFSYHTSDHLDEPFWGSGGILSRNPSANYYAWKM